MLTVVISIDDVLRDVIGKAREILPTFYGVELPKTGTSLEAALHKCADSSIEKFWTANALELSRCEAVVDGVKVYRALLKMSSTKVILVHSYSVTPYERLATIHWIFAHLGTQLGGMCFLPADQMWRLQADLYISADYISLAKVVENRSRVAVIMWKTSMNTTMHPEVANYIKVVKSNNPGAILKWISLL